MFTIEHEFDATVITLIDDAATPASEDVTVTIFDDGVALEQADPRTGALRRINFTMSQIEDLRAALNLPEGAYVRTPRKP
ncbi:hypothetical protein HMH01_12350 [Halovulum dunhuangense]|uniref:Phosphomannomutase n=1 Tax=Halovulum dunhuangense TaxID=1505036 RepID=A0A849L523_9RHOB|nr:hypothetical protein [Halovulum dunhuangense]NNU81227.1 hypothetical protein [Halovulum dunhuangense]